MAFVQTLITKRYRCPFCRHSWAHKDAAYRHVSRCYLNPEAQACKTCLYYIPSERPDYHGYMGCPERCGMSVSLDEGLQVHCSKWEAKDATPSQA